MGRVRKTCLCMLMMGIGLQKFADLGFRIFKKGLGFVRVVNFLILWLFGREIWFDKGRVWIWFRFVKGEENRDCWCCLGAVWLATWSSNCEPKDKKKREIEWEHSRHSCFKIKMTKYSVNQFRNSLSTLSTNIRTFSCIQDTWQLLGIIDWTTKSNCFNL